MSHIQRKWKKHHRPFFVMSFIAFVNLLFPQNAGAVEIDVSRDGVAAAIVSIEQIAVTQPIIESAATLPVPEPLPVKRTVRVVATAYSSSFDETDSDPFTTASGAKVADGVIAANGLAFGTKVRFPEVYGERVFIVLDRMSARYGKHRVDLWMSTKQEAKEWGVKYVRIEILK